MRIRNGWCGWYGRRDPAPRRGGTGRSRLARHRDEHPSMRRRSIRGSYVQGTVTAEPASSNTPPYDVMCWSRIIEEAWKRDRRRTPQVRGSLSNGKYDHTRHACGINRTTLVSATLAMRLDEREWGT